MKKRLAMLLTLVLTVTFVGGCGGASQGGVSNESKSTVKSESTDNKNSKSKKETLSEYLSTGKIIGYVVEEMDKSEKPDDIYFFENGKLTIIPGYEFGLTMGELSQMEEDEIWKKYKDVRKSYKEEYAKRNDEDLIGGAIMKYYGHDTVDESMLGVYERYEENATETGDEYRMTLGEYEQIRDIREELAWKGPFYDLDFTFNIKTDSTGNYLSSEYLVYPTIEEESAIKPPTDFHDILNFGNAEGGEVQIYDTTYNCLPLYGGDAFCTREFIKLDTVDRKNKNKDILIDATRDELDELYKEEVLGRYQNK